jgi:hypothetical protein
VSGQGAEVTISVELRDELLHALDDAIELADDYDRAVLAADLRTLFDRLLGLPEQPAKEWIGEEPSAAGESGRAEAGAA